MNKGSSWPLVNVGAKLKLISGFPFSSNYFSTENGFPLIRIRDVTTSSIETYYVGKVLPEFIVTQGDVLIGMDGDFNIAKWKNSDALLNQRVLKIAIQDSSSLDLEFLFYWLQPYIKKINDITAATTVKHLSTKDLLKIRTYFPSIETQQRIGAVLGTIDQTIEKTEALIEKYQHIKAGLMHDLFTRGIEANGNLRPPREEAPELYQQTVIGWIPKDWEVTKLESLLANVSNNLRSGPFGSALLKSELVENGVPFLGIDNIYPERFDDSFKRFVSESKFLQLSKYAVRPNDVVITIMGTVGRAALIPTHVTRALSSKHLWTMTFDPELVQPELVCWQLNSSAWVDSWFRKHSQGGIMDAIQSKTLRELQLPVPKKFEQKLIHERYQASNENLRAESNILVKLKKQKSGLMQDLLTGKVPVNVPSTEQATA